MSEQPVGLVIHYFPKIGVAGVSIVSGHLEIGDSVFFSGHTTGFGQTIESMQVEHEPVERAAAGDRVGIRVTERVRVGDKVFRDSPPE
jgi:putative protease